MITEKLKKFLQKENIDFKIINHPEKFTSQEIAASEHISGKEFAKVVMVKAQGKDIMVVVPADRTIDLLKLSEALGARDVHVEEEKEFTSLFPDCEAGAMPPFGSLYHLPCYVDQSVLSKDNMYFNGGNHHETVSMRTADYTKAEHATAGDFTAPVHLAS